MKKNGTLLILTIFLTLLILNGCATYTSKVENTPGRASIYSPPDTVGTIPGIGIESQDIISMCDKMVRDMNTNPILSRVDSPPRIIVDAVYFYNESNNQLNLNTIVDRLRTGLIRSANGRMIFIGRHYSDMVEKERKLKKQGKVDQGVNIHKNSPFGGDYRLGGRVTSLETQQSGTNSRFTQIVFEMVDLQTSAIIWSGEYSFRKTNDDSVIYN